MRYKQSHDHQPLMARQHIIMLKTSLFVSDYFFSVKHINTIHIVLYTESQLINSLISITQHEIIRLK
jgi:hypothetical protein